MLFLLKDSPQKLKLEKVHGALIIHFYVKAQVNFEGLEMQKWNIPTDRAERVDGKMGSFV